MTNDAKVICQRMDLLFKRLARTKYWLQVVNDHYDHSYNVFFNSQRKYERLKSVPLHTIATYDLSYLEKVLGDLRTHTQLTIEFEGFSGQLWPDSQRLIERVKNHYE
ncbi:acetyl-CoA carboxylase [Lactiplantibacillus plajomi]|uniref:Acetyl-CoA carboxylase n=1 Tax=Lactiplantibacillus plajomi TaxID=1457217 RepID=A0ABV6K588_9LACO|nr:acetyl-CoA carboxylase [Lactiplantibacillus plajomi]